MSLAINLTEAFRDLVQIGIALTSERDPSTLLNRIMAEARRFTRAEAGTLFLRENDELHFAVVQNDRLARRLGEAEMQRLLQAEPLKVSDLSLAGHVAMMGEVVNIPDTYTISPDRPYNFNPLFDARCDYKTRSALVVPLQDPAGHIFGVLELINALDKTGCVVPFDIEYEALVRALASQAAVASAERIREVIEQHEFAHGIVTVSLGVASLPEDAASGDDLVVAADTAMYEAKRLGRNRVAVV